LLKLQVVRQVFLHKSKKTREQKSTRFHALMI